MPKIRTIDKLPEHEQLDIARRLRSRELSGVEFESLVLRTIGNLCEEREPHQTSTDFPGPMGFDEMALLSMYLREPKNPKDSP